MSLATRCPACGTVFRVVRDQLKVSEGWVRCGRCSEVFNAGQRLFDLEQDSRALAALSAPPPAASAPHAAPIKAATAGGPHSGMAPLSPATARVHTGFAPPSQPAVLWAPESKPLPLVAPATPATSATDAQAAAQARASSDWPAWARPDASSAPAQANTPSTLPEPAWALERRPQADDLRRPPPEGVEQSGEATSVQEHAAPLREAVEAAQAGAPTQADMLAMAPDSPGTGPQPEPEPSAPAATEAQPTPGFVLRADRAARWRHPARRGSVALLALLLAALLGAQMALHYRDSLAAASPTAAKPWLEAACKLLGCRIEAPRRIDSLSVDSSGLVRVEGSPQYRLSMVVHNRASTAVRMPAIDLALTDTQGQTMARRVLTAAELGQATDSLPPRGEVVLQAMLELGEQRVAGYTVELFYP